MDLMRNWVWVLDTSQTREVIPSKRKREIRQRLSGPLNDPAVTGVPTSSLGLADNLDDLATAQTQVPCDGVGNLHAGQLGLLQTVPLQQFGLLFGAEENVLGDELVAGDVDQQILFLEMLADATGHAAQQAYGGRRDRGLRDEDTGVEVALVDDVVESAHLLGADARRVRAEVDVDRAAVGLGGRVRFARQRSVLHLHDLGGAGLDFHLGAAV